MRNTLPDTVTNLAYLMDDGVIAIIKITDMTNNRFEFGVITENEKGEINTPQGTIAPAHPDSLFLLGYTTYENLFLENITYQGKKYKNARDEYRDINPKSFSTIK